MSRKNEKISMKTPIVEMDGDEMTRVLWQMIKEELILPFVDLKTVYFDLSVFEREKSKNQITLDAAEAIKIFRVGAKCATITANDERKQSLGLSRLHPSPNATIRNALGGTVFRAPILVKNIHPFLANWKKEIVVARHAEGDIYAATEYQATKGSKVEIVLKDTRGGKKTENAVGYFHNAGIVQCIHTTQKSICVFAESVFSFALKSRMNVWFSAKDTISKLYDGAYRRIFEEVYRDKFSDKFEKAGISYFYTLIDDAVSRILQSEGGILWALKNYDGDVMSDFVASGFGSLAMMTSVLVSPDGCFEYEAAHGTVRKHWEKYRDTGIMPSTNPTATIFAWTGALKKRGEFDKNKELQSFAVKLEKATLQTIESGIITKDLTLRCEGAHQTVNSEEFIRAVRTRLQSI